MVSGAGRRQTLDSAALADRLSAQVAALCPMDSPLAESIIEGLGILVWVAVLFNFALWVAVYTIVQLTKLAVQGKFLKTETSAGAEASSTALIEVEGVAQEEPKEAA